MCVDTWWRGHNYAKGNIDQPDKLAAEYEPRYYHDDIVTPLTHSTYENITAFL